MYVVGLKNVMVFYFMDHTIYTGLLKHFANFSKLHIAIGKNCTIINWLINVPVYTVSAKKKQNQRIFNREITSTNGGSVVAAEG